MGKSLKGKELGKGISQRKDGLYQARFTDRFGKRRTIYARTVTEITRKLREEQYNDEKKCNSPDSSITLDKWFDIWIETYTKSCRDTTVKNYRVSYNRLRKDLGWRKLSDLSSVVIQQAFNKMETDAMRVSCKAVLRNMLNRAVESELIGKNTVSSVITNINHEEKHERKILSHKEIDILCEYSKNEDNEMYPLILVGLGTGMRMGEIVGLTWDDLDFDANLIHVKKTLCYVAGKDRSNFVFHKPKTTAGLRTIPMTVTVKEVFLRQKERRHGINEKYPGFEDLVFTSLYNCPYNVSTVDSCLHTLVQRMNRDGIPFERFSSHSLRHTFATNCIEKGMNPKVLQKILGHATLQMTMDLYCHVRDENIYNEMSAIMEMV